MCDTDLIAFLQEWLAVLVPLAQESAARAVAQQSIRVGGKGKQGRSTSYRSAHGTNNNPEDAPWAQGSTGRGATRLLLGLGLQLRATHAGGREALIDAYDLAESGRGAEIRARLFGRHGRGAGTGAETRKRANGLSNQILSLHITTVNASVKRDDDHQITEGDRFGHSLRSVCSDVRVSNPIIHLFSQM